MAVCVWAGSRAVMSSRTLLQRLCRMPASLSFRPVVPENPAQQIRVSEPGDRSPETGRTSVRLKVLKYHVAGCLPSCPPDLPSIVLPDDKSRSLPRCLPFLLRFVSLASYGTSSTYLTFPASPLAVCPDLGHTLHTVLGRRSRSASRRIPSRPVSSISGQHTPRC